MFNTADSADLHAVLARGLTLLDLRLPETTQARLLQFVTLLGKWNRAYNLTAVRDPSAMLTRHILDSLSVLPYVQGPRILDVGSGAGLPGIPLALARPDWQFTLLDCNGKKTRFIRQAVIELELANVTVLQGRIEEHEDAAGFDTVLARAFASIAVVARATESLWAPRGQLLLMKGVYPEQELADLPAEHELQSAIRVQVPGLDAERHVLVIRRRR